jgi:hypothetical protein
MNAHFFVGCFAFEKEYSTVGNSKSFDSGQSLPFSILAFIFATKKNESKNDTSQK